MNRSTISHKETHWFKSIPIEILYKQRSMEKKKCTISQKETHCFKKIPIEILYKQISMEKKKVSLRAN